MAHKTIHTTSQMATRSSGDEGPCRVSTDIATLPGLGFAALLTGVAVVQDGRFSAAAGAVAPLIAGIILYKLRYEHTVDLLPEGIRVRYRGTSYDIHYDDILRVSGGWRRRLISMEDQGIRVHLRASIEGLGDHFWFWPVRVRGGGERHAIASELDARMAEARFAASMPASAPTGSQGSIGSSG